MEKIIIPNINNNETEAKLVDWLVEEGEYVIKGQLIATLETTKATYDVEASCDGILQRKGVILNKYDFGKSIGNIYSTKEEYDSSFKILEHQEIEALSSIIITEPARKLIEHHNISKEAINSLGLKVIKVSDLESLLNENLLSENLIEISERQQAISKTVVISKNTIPEAFLVKKVNLTEALTSLKNYSSENNILVGITELIISSLSKLFSTYPVFFGTIKNEKFIKLSNSANIGVTIDIGNGLFIPVLSNANSLTIKQISEFMMIFRMKALRNNFNLAELTNSNITISLNVDEDTVFVKPIIFPGQACMLSVGAVLKEVKNIENGKVNFNYFLYLGLSYDHRIINGYEANSFLSELKNLVENPKLNFENN